MDGDMNIDLGPIATNGKLIAQALRAINDTLTGALPRAAGSFTMPAAASLIVTQTAVTSNCRIVLTATNAAAATLMGSAKSLYVSAKTPGASFTVATANAANAASTETFDYAVLISV